MAVDEDGDGDGDSDSDGDGNGNGNGTRIGCLRFLYLYIAVHFLFTPPPAWGRGLAFFLGTLFFKWAACLRAAFFFFKLANKKFTCFVTPTQCQVCVCNTEDNAQASE